MQRKASRLKAMMIAFLSISLAIILCASFHFDKIQQHEKYQNQLHFRELNLALDGITFKNNTQQIINVMIALI